MQPSDFLPSFGRGFGSPRQRPTSWGRRLFCRLPRRPARAPANAPALEMGHRLSVKPETPEERQGPPGLLGRPLRACCGALAACRLLPHFGHDLPSPLPLFEKIHAEVAFAFAQYRTLGIRNDMAFETKYPRPTRSRAYTSPAPLPDTVARLSTGSGGLTPGRAGFAPAGRQTKFHGVIASPPIPIDQQSLVALKPLCA
jgi:hypothetical protein